MRWIGRAVAALRHDRVMALLGVGAVVAVACCVGLGARWWVAADSEPARTAEARDAALRDGSRALETLNTIDHRSAASDVKAWSAVTSGALRAQLTGDRSEHIERAEERHTVTSASTLRAALSELDAVRGTARMLAVLRVDVDGDQGTERRRSTLIATLERDDEHWTVSNVQEGGS